MSEQPNDQKRQPAPQGSQFVWLAIGVAIGAGIGVAIDNIALGVGIGTAIGAAISVTLYLSAKKNRG